MKRILCFSKRNIIEMLRDPVSYIFGLGFPLVMLIIFQVINHYTNGSTAFFASQALVPAIMMFSFTFLMLLMALLVSKDKSTSFLKRLYTSPMKTHEFILGYAVLGILLGFIQIIITLVGGFIITLISKEEYFSFVSALLLILSQLPIMILSVFLGILIGSSLNDKAAPGICSIFISAAGILGGCWMPIETMGGFETFCRFLPFYPSVYLGRVATKATNSLMQVYTFDNVAKMGIVVIIIYMIVCIALSCLLFYRQAKNN